MNLKERLDNIEKFFHSNLKALSEDMQFLAKAGMELEQKVHLLATCMGEKFKEKDNK